MNLFTRFFSLFLSIFFSCSSNNDTYNDLDEDSQSNENIIYDINSIISKFEGTGLTYEIINNNVIFNSQNLPNHTSPYWQSSNELYETYNGSNSNFNLNPNRIVTQNITLTIPLYPSESSNHKATELGAIGISRNGVVFYNQYAGPNQPLTNEIDSFDQWLGHPQPQGAYHYHIEPTYLTGLYGQESFLGLLADGFPVYGPLENNISVVSSDLDEYHGHFSVTLDFPEGIYHYHITSDDPYINGSGYFGTPGNISN
jgi:hypothetical protein